MTPPAFTPGPISGPLFGIGIWLIFYGHKMAATPYLAAAWWWHLFKL